MGCVFSCVRHAPGVHGRGGARHQPRHGAPPLRAGAPGASLRQLGGARLGRDWVASGRCDRFGRGRAGVKG